MACLADTALPLTVHETGEDMAALLADRIRDDLSRALLERGTAVIAVSGGSTPAALYRRLSQADLDWSRVTIVLVDERWVDFDAPGSNAYFIHDTLLQGPAEKARFIGLKTSAETPLDAQDEVESRLDGIGVPDVVVLGMGADGHTASWFPRAQGLDAALSRSGRRVAAVQAAQTDVTGPHTQRMTLTLGAIAGAGRIVLMMAGASKREALERAVEPGPIADQPVRALLRAGDVALEIHWTE
ncbi:6-phosphogluconolactonase [Maricaulis parjimensis]|uniref:6-phosphogluconolactonase n=1 Tax=Maricaulis parjimensis TaxID=144023 RepID=UPI0019394A56|nr:6-phosphogluconolactonase [Maricaulis parjimensis]